MPNLNRLPQLIRRLFQHINLHECVQFLLLFLVRTLTSFAEVISTCSSGRGENTLLDILVGLLQPSAGSLAIDGISITEAG